MTTGRRLQASVLTLLVWYSISATARADGPVKHPWQLPARHVQVQRLRKTRKVGVSLEFRDVISPKIRKKLQSGLPTTIVLAGGVFDATTKKPVPGVALWRSCKIAYDVWNEVYRIHVKSSAGEHQAVALGLSGVLRRCGETKALALTSALPKGRRVFIAATVEVNPISERMLKNIRRWVSRPPGSSATGPGDSLFGSFVGIFIARIGRVDLRASFRTNVFIVP